MLFFLIRKLLVKTLRKKFTELQIFKNRLRQKTFLDFTDSWVLEKVVRFLSGMGLP